MKAQFNNLGYRIDVMRPLTHGYLDLRLHGESESKQTHRPPLSG